MPSTRLRPPSGYAPSRAPAAAGEDAALLPTPAKGGVTEFEDLTRSITTAAIAQLEKGSSGRSITVPQLRALVENLTKEQLRRHQAETSSQIRREQTARKQLAQATTLAETLQRELEDSKTRLRQVTLRLTDEERRSEDFRRRPDLATGSDSNKLRPDPHPAEPSQTYRELESQLQRAQLRAEHQRKLAQAYQRQSAQALPAEPIRMLASELGTPIAAKQRLSAEAIGELWSRAAHKLSGYRREVAALRRQALDTPDPRSDQTVLRSRLAQAERTLEQERGRCQELARSQVEYQQRIAQLSDELSAAEERGQRLALEQLELQATLIHYENERETAARAAKAAKVMPGDARALERCNAASQTVSEIGDSLQMALQRLSHLLADLAEGFPPEPRKPS